MTNSTNAIQVKGLRKIYGSGRHRFEALKGIDLDIPRGSFFGLLGPNGAGKSTFINILAGLVNKTEGHVNIWGFDIDVNPRNARVSLGVVPQEINMDAFFTPREALEWQAGLYGVPKSERRSDEILAALSLADKANAYSRTLSGGMKRRLLVAKALVHSPPILILDEPTAGVDIELRQQLWEYVRRLNESGVTIVLTTHYLEEAEALCDRIAIIHHGEVVACDETQHLLSRLDEKQVIVTVDKDVSGPPRGLSGFRADLLAPRRISLRYNTSTTKMGEIIAAFDADGLEIVDLSTKEADLEDIFVELTRQGGSRTAA